MTLISPLVSSCSPSDVTRSTRPSYSNATVPNCCTSKRCASAGRRSTSMYSTETLSDAYLYSSRRSRNRSNPSVRSKTRIRTGRSRPCRTFLRLLRQRELLRGGQVPPLVPPRRQVVDADENGENDRDAGKGQRSESRLPARERPNDFTPLAQDVEQRADQAGDRQPGVERLQLGTKEPDRDGGKDQCDTEPAEESENSFQHAISPSTVRCRPTSP